MAPKGAASQSSSSCTADTPDTSAAETVAAQQAEIEQLTALLQAAEARAASVDNAQAQPAEQTIATLLESIVRSLGRSGTPFGTSKSTKLLDPPIFTNGKDPTFESWKLQIRDKLQVNSDYFPTEEARIAYVFSCTGRDAQAHLHPRYTKTSEDPFLTDQEMINYLSSIYEDLYKVQNACLKYKGLIMKPTETFADFYTCFLHLAGQAKIPKEDLRPDLFDKLTLELQRTVLLVYLLLTTVKALADECLSLDQGLRRIKERSNCVKSQARTATALARKTALMTAVRNTATTAAMVRNAAATPAKTFSREATPNYVRPSHLEPSNQGACFSCSKKGHYALDYLTKGIDLTLVVQEVDAVEDTDAEADAEVDAEAESGKEEP